MTGLYFLENKSDCPRNSALGCFDATVSFLWKDGQAVPYSLCQAHTWQGHFSTSIVALLI